MGNNSEEKAGAKKKKNRIYLDFPSTETVVEKLAKHPYLWALGLCLFIHFIFLSDIRIYITSYSLFAEVGVLALAGSVVLFILHDTKKLGFVQYIVCELLYLLAVIGFMYGYSNSVRKAYWVTGFFAALSIVLFVYFYKKLKKNEYKDKLISLFIMALGFSVKIAYSLLTTDIERQHDWDDVFPSGLDVPFYGGHKGYIDYLMTYHSLPDNVDITRMWQYYHPPLYHTIAAIWVSFNKFILQFLYSSADLTEGFGSSRGFIEGSVIDSHAFYTVKTIALFCSVCIMITIYKIFRHFKLSGKALIIPMILTNFHSAFVFFAGSMNNDPLSVVFIMGAMLCTLRWYEDRTMKNILKIALCIGLGMMTKMSVALIAPSVALVFLVALIKYRKEEFKKLFGQFAAFGAVCIPLGLWFGIRNYLKWGIPINYIQESPRPWENLTLYVEEKPFQMITDFSPFQFKSVFLQSLVNSDYNDYNPLICLLKTSVFNEYINETSYVHAHYYIYICTVLFWIYMAIVAFSVVCMVWAAVKGKKISAKPMDRVFLYTIHIVLLVSYYIFSIKLPFVFTMNYRYVTPLGVIGTIFIGMVMKELQTKETEPGNKAAAVINKTVSAFVLAFSALMAVVCLSVTVSHL